MIETDQSGNYYGTAQKQSLRTKTPIAASLPTTEGIAIEIESDDETMGDSEDEPNHRPQPEAAGKYQKKSILTVHDSTIKHLTTIEKLILDEMVLNGRAIIAPSRAGESGDYGRFTTA